MEPKIAEEYDRLMDALQEAVEDDPQSDETKTLRRQVAAFLREHIGKAAPHPSACSQTVH